MGRILDALNIDERKLRVGAWINDQETTENLVECGYGITIVFERVVADREKKALRYLWWVAYLHPLEGVAFKR